MTTTSNKDSLIKKFADKFNFPDEQKLISTLKSTCFKVKDKEVTDEQMSALLIVADQYGLNPFTKEIFAFPDKQNGIVPVVGVDGWSRIINQHPDMDGLEFVYSEEIIALPGAKSCPLWIECVIYRKGRTHPIRIKEFLDETYREPFQGTGQNGTYTVAGPWQTHTKRLLRHKSMIQCSRIAFGFVGIYDQDEAERIIEGERLFDNEPTEISVEATKMAPRLIERAQKASAWQAALDYAGENFSGSNLAFVQNEINKAKSIAEALLITSQPENEAPAKTQAASVPNPTVNPSKESLPKDNAQEQSNVPLNNKKSPLADAKASLT
jgi:phage recombination protein Bet